ncbi:RidA family protein [Hephaestia sp. GCM10023244]|uniref:RidA family protein n=1 Tax=unclassified Hephaestia TaxID=2631281 RepID=UPI0020771C6D|nr:RidA family protein [Hephaestia sp. MAHUQ-44]MCM8732034.1 RidA family protein [Hephaestia sp. MAHUQ-44]
MRQKSITIDKIGHSAPIPLACRVGPLLATSGIMGRDATTGEMPPDAAGQAANCFRNLALVLAEAGMDLGDVVRFTIYVKREEDRGAINPPWLEAYPDPSKRPARHVQLMDLRGAVLVQLEVLAIAKEAL